MTNDHWDVIVVGAGAAGLVAAERAAARGRRTLLLEKNPHAGIKILMSGGTRCNLTHDTDRQGIVDAYGDQGPFLYSALAALSPTDLVKMFESEGVYTKVEDTGKVFPISDRAQDVLDALIRRLDRTSATLALGEAMTGVALESPAAEGASARFVITTTNRSLISEKLVITTGGRSYPGCGTSGDGYAWLSKLGHTIVPTRPALTPVTTNVGWVRELKGLTMPDVHVFVAASDDTEAPKGKRGKRGMAERRGSLLFTHFGLSGPVVLDVSRVISGHPQPQSLVLICDFLPHQNAQEVDADIHRECIVDGKRQIQSLLTRYAPRRLVEKLLSLASISATIRGAELSKQHRQRIVETLKQLRIPVSGTMGFRKAEVTAGGVSLNEVDSRNMQSKFVPNLYLAGEILDLDGPIGGYNFQAAFSTGVLAGNSV